MGRRKIFLALLCFLLAGPAFLAAQSTAVEMETLLAARTVTYAQASRFVLDAAGAAAFSDPAEAFGFAMERSWLPRNAQPDAPARLDGLSLLFMRSFGLRGGIMFTVTGAARFAYRDMEFMGLLHDRSCPAQAVSGETLLYVASRVIARAESGTGAR